MVAGTDPSGQAGRGSLIRVLISNGNVSGVPDVRGMDRGSAESTLKDAGFKVQVREEDTTDPNQDGVVISQSPDAGASAKSGDRVTIVIGKLSVGGGTPPGGNDGGGNDG